MSRRALKTIHKEEIRTNPKLNEMNSLVFLIIKKGEVHSSVPDSAKLNSGAEEADQQ